MNVLAPNWRHQLIGIATDGASAMTGFVQGTCTRLSNQLDLVLKKAFIDVMNEKFQETLTGVTGHL